MKVPAGSATWSNTLTLSKGISLLGAGRDNTFIVASGVCVLISPDSTAITNDEVIRVEGFSFDGNNAAINIISVQGSGASATKPFKNLAIGNNRLKNMSNVTSGSGAVLTNGQVRGAIYNNIFDRCNVIVKNLGNDDTTEWSNGNFPFAFGSSDSLFFEANAIQYSTSYSGGDPGWFESGQGARLVVRYNTFDFKNATCTEYWDVHGFQNWPGNGQTGTMVVEYYGNTLTNTSGYRWINHRGSWGLFFNNIMTGANSGSIDASQYGVGDVGGSGCTGDVPGALGHYTTEINNTYVFNNTVGGITTNMHPGSVYGCGIKENSNYWNYNPSFNGSTGIGRGTSAPSSNCTVGVGYWKASTATPTVDPNVIQNGHLYKCLSTNVWTDYYTPYVYPHPLAVGSPTPTPTPTASPTPTPTATPGGDLSFSADSGVISSPFSVNADKTVSQTITTVDPALGGKALYTFNVTVAGDYVLSVVVNCPDDSSNSFFVNIDAEPTTANIWSVPVTSGFESREATWSPDTEPKVWTLGIGSHQLIIRGREANAVLKQMVLNAPPGAPDGLQILP